MKRFQPKNSNLKKNSFLQPLTSEDLGMVYGGNGYTTDYQDLLDQTSPPPNDNNNGG